MLSNSYCSFFSLWQPTLYCLKCGMLHVTPSCLNQFWVLPSSPIFLNFSRKALTNIHRSEISQTLRSPFSLGTFSFQNPHCSFISGNRRAIVPIKNPHNEPYRFFFFFSGQVTLSFSLKSSCFLRNLWFYVPSSSLK